MVLKYVVLSYRLEEKQEYKYKEFKTYEKAKSYFEQECADDSNVNVQLMDVVEEKKK
jgi:hypothetical protein